MVLLDRLKAFLAEDDIDQSESEGTPDQGSGEGAPADTGGFAVLNPENVVTKTPAPAPAKPPKNRAKEPEADDQNAMRDGADIDELLDSLATKKKGAEDGEQPEPKKEAKPAKADGAATEKPAAPPAPDRDPEVEAILNETDPESESEAAPEAAEEAPRKKRKKKKKKDAEEEQEKKTAAQRKREAYEEFFESDGQEAPAGKKKKSLRQWFRNLYADTDDGAWDYDARIRRDVEMHQEVVSNKRAFSEKKTVSDFCEQLVDLTYQEEDLKREYQLVTAYLVDIQKIEELPQELAAEIQDTARKIELVEKSRNTYVQSENLLPMEQFNRMQRLEDEVQDTVVKLTNMEMRDSMLKSDMGHLEGEKEDLKYMREEFSEDIMRTRGIVSTVLILFLLAVGVLLSIALYSKLDVMLPSLVIGLVAVISFAVAYVHYVDVKNEIKVTDAKLKRAISLLNKVKVKYINNTNTRDYIYEKYGVNSGKELEYNWELYNKMVQDARRYSQANTDYRVYCDELVEQLTRIGVKDPLVWPKQTQALIDHREMVEIKHSLNTRRKKLRDQLASCDKMRENARIALHASAEGNPEIKAYIREILGSYKIDFV